MPILIETTKIEDKNIEIYFNKCNCLDCNPNNFFSMIPFYRMKKCTKRNYKPINVPKRNSFTCKIKFDINEYVPKVNPYSPMPISKQDYEFNIDGKSFIYHGVFVLTTDDTDSLIYECSVDWIEHK